MRTLVEDLGVPSGIVLQLEKEIRILFDGYLSVHKEEYNGCGRDAMIKDELRVSWSQGHEKMTPYNQKRSKSETSFQFHRNNSFDSTKSFLKGDYIEMRILSGKFRDI